jgi:hypothetical protein
LRISFCVLVIVLFCAWPMQSGFAAEAASTSDSKAALPAASSNSQPGSGEDARSDAGGANSDKNSDPIDTRISLQPRRSGPRPGPLGDAKANAEAPVVRNAHRRTFFASRPSAPTVRNAIGASVAEHESPPRIGGERIVSPVLPRTPAAGTTTSIGNAAGLAKNGAALEHPTNMQRNTNPIGGSTALTRGAIGGTSLSHRGAGPSSLGGPAKTIAGINGTTVRLLH